MFNYEYVYSKTDFHHFFAYFKIVKSSSPPNIMKKIII